MPAVRRWSCTQVCENCSRRPQRETCVHDEARIDTEHEHEALSTAMLAAAVVLVAQAPSRAEDIDLFVQPPGTSRRAAERADRARQHGELEPAFTNEIAALVSTVNGLPVERAARRSSASA